MNHLLLTSSLAVLLVGCATPQDRQDAERRVRFACENGETVEVRFLPARNLAVLSRDGQEVELKQEPSGSGFLYSNGPVSIKGKGQEILLGVGGMVPIRCNTQ